MERGGSGGTLLNVRTRTLLFSCALLGTSLIWSSSTYGLSVKPVLDRALSVTKLNEPENFTPSDNRRGVDKPEDNAPSNTTHSSSNNLATTPAVVTAPAATVIAEPLEELPSIDTFDAQQRIARISLPTSSSATVASSTAEPLARNVSPLLGASDHGWRIFGVAWYIWVLAAVGSVYATRWVMGAQRQSVAVEQIN